MRIIDIHTHIYPPQIAKKASESICTFYDLHGSGMDGTVEQLLIQGKKAGIDRFVVLPVGIKPDRVRHVNDFILEETAKEPKFIGFGTVHAHMENLLDEVEYIIGKGLKGIKMHPDSQRFAIDDPRLLPVYDRLQGKLPILLHMGDQRYNYSHPVKLRKILDQFPRLQVIAAHFGGYSMYETAYELLHDTDCIFDISSSMMFMPQGIAESYINRYGASRMAYGTDYPLWNPSIEVKRFQRLKLTEEQFDQISHKTAEEILGL